jgi:hypothetical protein
MMKSAEDWPRDDLAVPLNGTTERRVFGKGEVRPDAIIIGGEHHRDPAQMALAEDHDIIEALLADRADQALRVPILPEGSRRC